jgi:hypothetical protein
MTHKREIGHQLAAIPTGLLISVSCVIVDLVAIVNAYHRNGSSRESDRWVLPTATGPEPQERL